MTIEYAILGMLSWKPMTGYDMKRMMQESPVMYWSGNNNQIYKALVSLLDQGYATSELQYQESAPNKKIYSITERGQEALLDWVFKTEPELPEFKKTFLIQLSWAGNLSVSQIEQMLTRYEIIISEQLAMRKEEKRRQKNFPNRSRQEQCIWEGIYENLQMALEAEQNWIQQFRKNLKERIEKEDEN